MKWIASAIEFFNYFCFTAFLSYHCQMVSIYEQFHCPVFSCRFNKYKCLDFFIAQVAPVQIYQRDQE